ncbi:MAG: T9SS type A sorting domain-containing protein [Prolixibacteraceae bacterium]|nr:T9SS type A sorting domain-containing protein [Prolixibacteraceae bacterium]
MKYPLLIFVFFGLIAPFFVSAQISDGGQPLEIAGLKSVNATRQNIKLPAFKQSMIKETPALFPGQKLLRYAHPFPVNVSTANTGEWLVQDGFRVWQLEIESEGAYSLQVIFSKFKLPAGARLFLFTRDKSFVLGAFTEANNKSFERLATYPVPGERVVIQYEEPMSAAIKGELEIGRVYHDYKGFFGLKNRINPRRTSGECNVDINCAFGTGLENEQRAVCRIIAAGELGTGTLLNNTALDKKPLVISAYHVFKGIKNPEVAIFDFNYESPFCTGLDGSDVQTVSGATALAAFDSLDFVLAELSELPPPTYRPYLAGWDATNTRPSNCYTIHHPNGDTKKISHDDDVCDSARYNRNFVNYGHWKVHNWESGTTEGGSSGGGLFDENKHVTGTLSGGNASCEIKSYDLFTRMDKLWNYRKETDKRVQPWLDPVNSGTRVLDGMDPYADVDTGCTVSCNFIVDDTLATILTPDSTGDFFTGNNAFAIEEVAECFTGFKRVELHGVLLGISSFKNISDDAEITFRVYSGDRFPGFAEKQYKYPFSSLTGEAMNFFPFEEPVTVEGNFFVSVVIPVSDSIIFYQSAPRPLIANNSMLIKHEGVWKQASDFYNNEQLGASLLMQVVLCGAEYAQNNDTITKFEHLFKAYPNPAKKYVVVEFKQRAAEYEVKVFDMAGKILFDECVENRMYAEINTSDYTPGIYVVKVIGEDLSDTKRIMVIPD